jgi:cell division protein FtsB
MAAPLDPRQSPRRDIGPEPLRRKRVQPVAAGSSRRGKIVNGLLVFVTVVLVLDSLMGDKGLMERMRARRTYLQAAASLHELKRENANLRERIRRLNEEPSEIEWIAREELGFVKPGEVLFIIRDAKPQAH